jgi:DNA-binding LacI/PurR family transcriptional regulator
MIKFQLSKTNPLPLHVQLLDDLRHKVMTGVLRPHDRLPGEWEIAEDLGISRTTIQKAWQSAEEEKLIYRIHGKGTFVVGDAVSSTARKSVGWIVPDFRSVFAAHVVHSAEQVFRRKNYHVQVAVSEYKVDEEDRVVQRMYQDGVKGFIVWAAHSEHHERLLSQLSQSVPTVLLDRPIAGLHLPCVGSNNYVGGMQAMTHLLELGHRKIAFLARPNLYLIPVAERYRAYRDALQSIGEEPSAPILIGSEQELSTYDAYQNDDVSLEPLISCLQSPDRPTAIFAVNDWMALRVLRAVAILGLRIPEDLSLVGFDNLEVSQLLTPSLTTVAQNAELLGIEAAHRLLDLIDGEPSREVLTLVPTDLMVRESTRAV